MSELGVVRQASEKDGALIHKVLAELSDQANIERVQAILSLPNQVQVFEKLDRYYVIIHTFIYNFTYTYYTFVDDFSNYWGLNLFTIFHTCSICSNVPLCKELQKSH